MDNNQDKLKRDILSRHIVMISLGGTISASFFLGIGSILNTVGAFGTVIGFFIGGIIMMLVMISLAEMAIEMPISGSFQSYATKFISPYSGFLTGWLYLLNWLTAAAGGLVAAGIICNNFYPAISVWQFCLAIILIVSLLNLCAVRVFAEIEFWLSAIKIITIIIFIIIGIGIIGGFLHSNKPIAGLVNFYVDGLFPNGFKAFLFGLVIIVCTFQGAEVVGIAAGETKEPEKNIRKAIRSVAVRILLFFVFSSFIIAYVIPYKDSGITNTPFVTVLQLVNIKYVDTIMQLVILSASLSAVNSCFYTCARLMWSMAEANQAPKIFAKISKKQVPIYGVVFVALLSCICLITKFIGAEKIFILVISSSGMVGCMIWIIISMCHIYFRKSLTASQIESLRFKAWGFPLIPYTSILFNSCVILAMFWDPEQRMVVYSGVILILLFSFLYKFYYKKIIVKT
ncbi:amino acid transporter [Francisella tularensis subsp. holarctica PHIT-FT049]|uniref:amino acid permease n=1 Tax=Francisella tularensis TaxID=263 RepID=UPI00015D79B8|nr:amino acid permease [Francisella tularensis]AHH46600.1 amino acid transporter [Francisella tularensis subsp. holarctica PHIT-FT049]ALK93776.1 amino acid transporter [Francisella tularensis]EDO66562.1 amino-acid permease [Francisella tularensis subsp. holarctica FSC022]KIP31609.1 amino acid permease family protein [Francisella tularensis subsp. holarctica]MCC9171673.1 amino acid permease [Francisella tularensis]